MPHSKKNFLI